MPVFISLARACATRIVFKTKSGAEIMKKHAYVWICGTITRVDKEKRCGIPNECDFIIYHMYRCNA